MQADQHAADPPVAAAAQGGGAPDGNAGTEDGDEEAAGVDEEAASESSNSSRARKEPVPPRAGDGDRVLHVALDLENSLPSCALGSVFEVAAAPTRVVTHHG